MPQILIAEFAKQHWITCVTTCRSLERGDELRFNLIDGDRKEYHKVIP